jgi:hypothetical protein
MITPNVFAFTIEPIPVVANVETTKEIIINESVKIKEVYTKEDIIEIINTTTARYDISSSSVTKLISCETGDTFDTNIQSSVIQSYGREQSYGLAQIHMPAHPSITIAQARNPYFAVEFISKNWKNRESMWVTCTKKLQI